jgi:hypothetical protein
MLQKELQINATRIKAEKIMAYPELLTWDKFQNITSIIIETPANNATQICLAIDRTSVAGFMKLLSLVVKKANIIPNTVVMPTLAVRAPVINSEVKVIIIFSSLYSLRLLYTLTLLIKEINQPHIFGCIELIFSKLNLNKKAIPSTTSSMAG